MNKQKRITEHPVLGRMQDREEVTFTFDGHTYKGFKGDTIASALLANGVRRLRVHEETGTPRGIYCNIGHCFECRTTVDGADGVRACLTPIREGMEVKSGQKEALPLDSQHHDAHKLPKTYADFAKQEAGDPHV
ncbi:Sarcosine oxidase [Lentibacillus sp. JNUCC-1]|uniref:(2Fe-2S)-binding protein n=1 Tax=Lentibacillus sp. JNUCC-1 TaxID=2654513 RepID=UPI0012E7641F|nr:(2Fe-2S)-binding protein [Lentibacillus sp. JNUCC-1]MUV36369.1 Sarcosine oxidase [Lentibacillus sp. JNUCC-1]